MEAFIFMMLFFSGMFLVFLGTHLMGIWWIQFVVDVVTYSTTTGNYKEWSKSHSQFKTRTKVIGTFLLLLGLGMIYYVIK